MFSEIKITCTVPFRQWIYDRKRGWALPPDRRPSRMSRADEVNLTELSPTGSHGRQLPAIPVDLAAPSGVGNKYRRAW